MLKILVFRVLGFWGSVFKVVGFRGFGILGGPGLGFLGGLGF